MQRQLSPVGLFTALISFTAGTLICMQLQQAELVPGWKAPAPLLWTLEAAIFAMIVYGWRPSIDAGSWALTVVGFLAVRNLIGVAGGLAVSVSGGGAAGEAIRSALGDLPTRACAVVFSIMVIYPLRAVLPSRARLARARLREGSAEEAAARRGEPGSGLLLLMEGEGRGKPEKREAAASAPEGAGGAFAVPELEGGIVVPLGALLPQLPQQAKAETRAQGLDPDLAVEVPFRLILPQLREARLQLSASELAELLPSGGAWSGFREYLRAPGGPAFTLPLQIVIPQLPPEALELPPLAVPGWAKLEEGEKEELLFAVV
jgi:hypothetical protein